MIKEGNISSSIQYENFEPSYIFIECAEHCALIWCINTQLAFVFHNSWNTWTHKRNNKENINWLRWTSKLLSNKIEISWTIEIDLKQQRWQSSIKSRCIFWQTKLIVIKINYFYLPIVSSVFQWMLFEVNGNQKFKQELYT